MPRLLYLFIIFLLFNVVFSCGSTAKLRQHETAENRTAMLQQLGLESITEVKFTKKIDGCMSTAARMYTDHGAWHDAVHVKDRIPTFIWRGVKLLSSSDKLFTVYTSGVETMEEYYSSVMIVDEKREDALASDSPFRKALIDLFENKLKGIKNDEFYREFWKFHDPKRYRELYHPKKKRDYVLYY